MLAAVEHKESTGDGRKKEQPVLRKHIVMHLSPSCFLPHHVLLHLVVPIQRGQVDVRGRLVLRPTGDGFGPEEGMDDHCGEAETDGSERGEGRTFVKSITHPNMSEEFPAGCGTNFSRLSKASNMRSGSGSSAWGMDALPWTLRE